MKNKPTLSDRFLERLLKQNPDKSEVVGILSGLFGINKVSAYRKLRGEAKFSVDELGILSRYFGISLDEITGVSSDRPYESVMMDIPLHQVPGEYDEETHRWEMTRFMDDSESEDSETGMAVTTLPRFLYMGYGHITRYINFKWAHGSKPGGNLRFDQIQLSDEAWEYCRTLYDNFRKIGKTFVVWDERIIPNIVKDIKYYRRMGFISDTDAEVLRSEMEQMIASLETYASVGAYAETGNSFELYWSSLNIDTSHSFFHTGESWSYNMVIYNYRTMLTNDRKTVMAMKQWIVAQRTNAVLISSSGARERKQFFDMQRKALEEL